MPETPPKFALLERGGWRSIAVGLLVVLAVGLVLAFLWFTASSLFVVFAGVLFAAFLDACARGLRPILPIGRVWRLSIVIVVLTGITALALLRGAAKLPEQVRALIAIIDAQIDVLQERLLAFGIDSLGPEGGRNFQGLLPDMGQLFGHATVAVGTAMLIWAVGIYTVIQTIEGYIIGPMIQKRAADVPSAWTLIGIVLFGTLFGTLGVALAMPLMAVGRIALIRFYVEDWLGDREA